MTNTPSSTPVSIEGMSEYDAAQFFRKRSMAMESAFVLAYDRLSEVQLALGQALQAIRETDSKFGIKPTTDPMGTLAAEARESLTAQYPETANMTNRELFAFLTKKTGG